MKKTIKMFLCIVACICLIVVGVTAYAMNVPNGLLAYFTQKTEMDIEEILSPVASVSDDKMELRIDGIIADEHTFHLVTSFIGLTEEYRNRFNSGDFSEAKLFQVYAVSNTGERLEFQNKESSTYTQKNEFGRKATTMFADADMTYLVSGTLSNDINMSDINAICFEYEDLKLELDIAQYMFPEYELYAENTSIDDITNFHISRIGFYFTTPVDEDLSFDVKLIYADGSVFETTDKELGYRTNYSYSSEDEIAFVTGKWGGNSVSSIGIIDLEDYCGVQINGKNYYFTNEVADQTT